MTAPQKQLQTKSLPPRFYEFGPFRLDTRERLLFRGQMLVSLPLKVFETLLSLVQNHGHIVDKSTLTRSIWPDSNVGPRSLAQNIFQLRRTLSNRHSEFIETMPKRGYRFRAPVRWSEEETAEMEGEENRDIMQPIYSRNVLSIRQLAVLPFGFLDEGQSKPDEEYLAVGLADALITRFSELQELIVRPTSAILKYSGGNQNLLQAGQELGVDSILEGKIQRSESKIRVTLQLVNAYNGAAVWADWFECDQADIFALQDAISERVVQSLTLKLTASQKARLGARDTQNPEAYKDYMKGRFHWNKRTAEGLLKAIGCFESSLRKDSRYALAMTGLADCYNILCFYGAFAPKEVFPKAISAATRAMEIEPNLVEAVTSRAFSSLAFEWNWGEAEQWFQRALDLNPNYPTAHQWYAEYQLAMGCLDDAIAAITHAQELDPLSININRQLGFILCYARKYDLAIEQIESALDLDPKFANLYHDLGLAYSYSMQPEEAITAFQKADALVPHDPDITAHLAYVYAVTGWHKAEAAQILDRLREMATRKFVSPFLFAVVHVGLGEHDLAFEWLERAFADRSNWLIYLNVDPALDPLHSDSRFRELQIKMALPLLGR